MKKFILVILLPVIISGCTLIPQKNSQVDNNSVDKTLIFKCCGEQKDVQPDAPLCKSDFKNECNKQGGALVFYDLHPVGGACYECRKKSPDAGKACASDSDCNVYCDFAKSIGLGNCKEIKKEKSGYNFGTLYNYTYQCSDPVKPGVCAAVKMDRTNPGGKTIKYEIKDGYLYRLETPGPIN